MNAHASFVTNAIRRNARVRDTIFDRVYPPSVQRVSSRFWTPVDVALTATGWLKDFGADAVLDVGSGAGKFCIVASLAADVAITGIEQRTQLVDAARAAAVCYGANVSFSQGTLESVDPARYDAFYLFNPFAENLYSADEQYDDSVELSERRCFRDLALVERWLDVASVGKCVVTYHGFGGRIPSTYSLMRSAPRRGDHLRLWQKRRAGRASGFYLELDQIVLSSAHLDALCGQLENSENSMQVREILDRPLS